MPARGERTGRNLCGQCLAVRIEAAIGGGNGKQHGQRIPGQTVNGDECGDDVLAWFAAIAVLETGVIRSGRDGQGRAGGE